MPELSTVTAGPPLGSPVTMGCIISTFKMPYKSFASPR